MRIKSFEYRDADGWTLEPMTLDGFNLLVGVSGAGKTRIVRAIERVCAVALGSRETEKEAEEARGASFSIDFDHAGLVYRWEAELEPAAQRADDNAPTGDAPLIRRELILRDGEPLVERTPERFILMGQSFLRMNRAKSAIATLGEEPELAPLRAAFSRCISKVLDEFPSHGTQFDAVIGKAPYEYRSIDELGANLAMPLHHKADFLKTLFPGSFQEVESSFREAFPLVEKLDIFKYRPASFELAAPNKHNVSLVAQEAGVHEKIFFHKMSSGMQRYLSFLIHLSFAPPGTVVLIDELESGLGVNCLPAATRFLLSRARDLQFVITSHHPYIIEQVPPRHWKIVTRHGSRVSVLDASNIATLSEGRSHLDRFTRLINLPEYEDWAQKAAG
jgi:predicted ATPase